MKISKLRICTVPYYNTLPLTWYLKDVFLDNCVDFELQKDYPFSLEEKLRCNQIDIAMMPIASMLTLPESVILGDAGIATNRQVKSVMLYSQKQLDQVRTLALDNDSRTSVVLAQLILLEYYKNNRYSISPLTRDMSLETVAMQTDACVVIGDRALTYVPTPWRYHFDLGELWRKHTDLPFVFAAWVAMADKTKQKEWESYGVIKSLQKARDLGVAEINTIARTIVSDHQTCSPGPKFPIDAKALEQYYQENIVYTLSDAHRKAIHLFLELGTKYRQVLFSV